MMPYQLFWLILFLPLISFGLIVALVLPFKKNHSHLGGYITVAAIGSALVLSVAALITVYRQPDHSISVPVLQWLTVGDFSVQVGIMMDSLTAVMLVVVCSVSLLVQIYSLSYMHADPGFNRFYAWMSLFTASMLGLILADNLLVMYIFWEMVGLCSYLLIGFWFDRPAAARAAKKAFIMTRVGDFGFLIAILILYANTGTFDTNQINALAVSGGLTGAALTWAALGIFAGAAGKSAQFPLHTWLPDAMEGPTPVSALIHAATMVAAGVFLVARTYPLFEQSTTALTTVAVIGAFTAIMAASIGLVMTDIKKVLAYSTISQLGYMMLGLATGGVAVGMFHLFTHAFFKALLFLGAGSIHHATGTYDMREMGGLRRVMPWTSALFVIASLSLVGIWPLAGFWSKDAILESALVSQPVLFGIALFTVLLTAFYTFRMIFLTFGGETRGVTGGHSGHTHESPRLMVVPMVVLGIMTVIAGFWNAGGSFSAFLGAESEGHNLFSALFTVFTHPLPLISLGAAGLGIFLAYAIYRAGWIPRSRLIRVFQPLYNLLVNKLWLDIIYENLFVKQTLLGWLFARVQWFDTRIVDGTVNGVAHTAVGSGTLLRRIQTGQLQTYALSIGAGLVTIIICVLLFGA